ncbi:hypothetical protein Gbth_025_050 [Gluconobacter thailandicus F149-1 = NBRC 100600]|uniref:Uncharacterized protein n=2 Tax=Gluconobacter thailandicus TaxID=257438 RepID=A0AAJ0QN39_GLUTH|nr:hypothetical protein [Gluconobacter thailandicus]AFW01060.1 hypothetical protein B932_1481 [Gluconobacter oxydans H24]ANQ40298.1 hypothetical protein BAR24_01755 [Gluconobacter oxydans]GAN91457.1 hypothetical protein Gbfr_037_052 [Gluconobacter frateurii M-2]KXV32911.1 hypothetical protein AD940_13170 [Gluconobacter thailandicus]KXV52190.1 hypothetical protein AD946_14770 [Gluconobacter thailandicus]
MLNSKVIHVNGVFLGTAIMNSSMSTLRFYATHESVRALHNACMPDLLALYCQVRRLFNSSRLTLQGA